MKFIVYSWMLGLLALLDFQLGILCDYISLSKCGLNKSCWPNLDVKMMTFIRDNIKYDARPCNNFWLFACGEWQSQTVSNYTDNFSYLMESYVNKLDRLFSSESQQPAKTKGIKNLVGKLRSYYQSCIAFKNNSQLPNLRRYLTDIPKMELTAWFISGTSNGNTNISWLKIIAELRLFGLNGILIDERATVAFNDSTKNVVELKMPMQDKSFADENELLGYFLKFNLVHDVTGQLKNLIGDIFELEQQLIELRTRHRYDEESVLEEFLRLRELREKVPNVNWKSYFSVLLEQSIVSDELPIAVNGIGYFRELAVLLQHTDHDILALYMLMQLCKYIEDIRPQISNRHCLDHIGTLMPLGLNYIYKRFAYETYRNDEETLNRIFKELKLQFQRYVHFNKLNLNEKERCYVQEKLDKMILRLGNLPSNVESTKFYNQHYNAVNLSENFYKNHWQMLRFRTVYQHRGLIRSKVHLDPEAFYVYDDIHQMRNAPYFVNERNLLVVPMIFMQLPFFHHQLQPLLHYSLVGFILGHELSHAFESDGISIDAVGNVNPIGFNIKRKNNFISNVHCFLKTKTVSLVERMADVNGFQLAYDTYFNLYGVSSFENNYETKDFFGEFTAKQLFFLNFAQFFCGKLPEPINHDADDVRVNEIVKNMLEFRKIFHCRDEKLKPREEHVCEMWRS